MYIQWFPGHMTKALRMIEENISLIDVVGYILDARAPYSCFNPAFDKILKNKPCVFILNKADLADPKVTEQWLKYFKSKGETALQLVSTKSGGVATVKEAFGSVRKKNIERWAAKGIYRPTRAIILGVPNCGKSTLINSLSGKKNALVGNKAGVTKGKQWIRLAEGLELLDTPGTLWNKFENQTIAQNLLFVGSISDVVVDAIEAATILLQRLKDAYPDFLFARYKLSPQDADCSPYKLLDKIAINRGCLLKGEPDTLRAANMITDEFKNGKIGRISLEKPSDYGFLI